MLKKNGPGCPCCCKCQYASFYYPETITVADYVRVNRTPHPNWPYSMVVTATVRIQPGAVFRLLLSYVDADNYLAIEVEPDAAPDGCTNRTWWIRFFQIAGGVETMLGNELCRGRDPASFEDGDGVAAGEWSVFSCGYVYGQNAMMWIPYHSHEAPMLWEGDLMYFPYCPSEWPVGHAPGQYAGYASKYASPTATIEVKDFNCEMNGLFPLVEGKVVNCPGIGIGYLLGDPHWYPCNDIADSCWLIHEEYDHFAIGDVPCTFEPGTNFEIGWDLRQNPPTDMLTVIGAGTTGTGMHRSIIHDSAISIGLQFTWPALNPDTWTSVRLVVDGHTIVVRYERVTVPPNGERFTVLIYVDSVLVETAPCPYWFIYGGYLSVCIDEDGNLDGLMVIDVSYPHALRASGLSVGQIALGIQQPADKDGTGIDFLGIFKYNNYADYYGYGSAGHCGCDGHPVRRNI